jgi:4-amino-4-deoxy-L-arabinose transferase-like glycosyltransferase
LKEAISRTRVTYLIYALALITAISAWFLAIRAPLWLDETSSFFVIDKGFWQIAPRQGPLSSPAYSYILWFSSKLLGTSEIALRVPSIVAMLAAVYLLYLAARELFGREIAVIAAIVFSLNPIIVFASIDVRPYAFAAAVNNATILVLLRLRNSDSNSLAALFGFLAAGMIHFHFLSAAILPALFLCFAAFKSGQRTVVMWRQLIVSLAAFVLSLLPLVPDLQFLSRSGSKTHVFYQAPHFRDLLMTLLPIQLYASFLIAAVVTAAIIRAKEPYRIPRWKVLLCLSLALSPILILYSVSIASPIQIFLPRYRFVAIPGIALSWAMLLSPFRSRNVRLLFCLLVVSSYMRAYLTSSQSRRHNYTWKYALAVAEANSSKDNSPVLICSDFPQTDYVTVPVGSAKDSPFYTQLSYYKLSSPVVPLPRALNDEAIRVGSLFLREATQKHERFLALAWSPSYPTLDWLVKSASKAYSIRTLGIYDGIKVLEFTPRSNLELQSD